MRTRSRIIQYLMKTKYKGNPNPMNSNYFELFKSETSSLIIGFRQQEQITLLELGFSRSSTKPGLLALA